MSDRKSPEPEPNAGDYLLEAAPPGIGFYVTRHPRSEERKIFPDPVSALNHIMQAARTSGKRAFRRDSQGRWVLLRE